MPFILRGTFCSTHLFFRFVSDLDSFCISRCGPVAQRLPVFSLSSVCLSHFSFLCFWHLFKVACLLFSSLHPLLPKTHTPLYALNFSNACILNSHNLSPVYLAVENTRPLYRVLEGKDANDTKAWAWARRGVYRTSVSDCHMVTGSYSLSTPLSFQLATFLSYYSPVYCRQPTVCWPRGHCSLRVTDLFHSRSWNANTILKFPWRVTLELDLVGKFVWERGMCNLTT